jgi:hypothetical protein
MTYKLILTDAFYFFTRNLRQIFTWCVPFLLASSVINQVIIGGGDGDIFSTNRFFLSLATSMALYPIYTGALIQMMARQAHNELPANSQLLSAALRTYVPLLVLAIIGRTFMMLGLIAFIVPGIWVAVRLAFAEFFLVIEHLDPRMAILKSFQATRRNFFHILTTLALLSLPILLLILVTERGLDAMHANQVVRILADTAITFLSLFIDVVMFRIFMETWPHQPGGDTI